jgi:uncharacterized repeat protein (TIGR03803 family)
MRTTSSALASRISLLGFLLIITTNLLASAPVGNSIYSFAGQPDGMSPANGLVADSAGNLYGVAEGGLGNGTLGVVFEMTPPATAGGAWTETILYSFLGGAIDGAGPYCTLIFDRQGNLYGTTTHGGPGDNGTIFELSPPATAGGAWTEKILYIFPADGLSGVFPSGKLSFDPSGNLYGTTWYGGSGTNCNGTGCGTVYKLTAPATAGGTWTESVLHNFGVTLQDGVFPAVNGVLYRGGDLYGTTQQGGIDNNGTVFVLIPKSGAYVERILHKFTVNEGADPVGGLIADSGNNLYGVTLFGGGSTNCGGGCGAIYMLSPPAVVGGAWTETTLYAFTGGLDGSLPWAGLWRDQAGSLYGTTRSGGLNNRHVSGENGVVFRLKPPAVSGGSSTLVPLYEFKGGVDGGNPSGELILVKHVFYGTTLLGGATQNGAVFSVGP